MNFEAAVSRCTAAYKTMQASFPKGEHPPYLDFKRFCLEVLNAETRRLGRSKFRFSPRDIC